MATQTPLLSLYESADSDNLHTWLTTYLNANFTTLDNAARLNGANAATSAMTLDLSLASDTAGLKVPSKAGAAPTADGQLAFDTTTHTLVVGSNGSTKTLVTSVLFFVNGQITQNTTTYFGLITPNASETVVEGIVPFAMTIDQLHVGLFSAAVGGSAQTIVVTLRKNNVDTALTCTLNTGDTTKADAAHTVSFAAGDTIALKFVASATSGSIANAGASVRLRL